MVTAEGCSLDISEKKCDTVIILVVTCRQSGVDYAPINIIVLLVPPPPPRGCDGDRGIYKMYQQILCLGFQNQCP